MSGNLIKWMISGDTAQPETIVDIGGDNLVALKPELVISDLIKNNPGYTHYLCPAFTDALRNTYMIRCPFDVSIRVVPGDKFVGVNKNEQFANKYLWNRPQDYIPGQNMMLSLNIFFLFITDDDIEIEQLPCLYHSNDWISKTQIITGKFNINKWSRSLEAAVILKNSTPKDDVYHIDIKRGDPLFYVRFHPANKKHVKLEQELDLHKILEYTQYKSAAVGVKRIVPNLQLPVLYKMFERFKPKNFIKKCPFK